MKPNLVLVGAVLVASLFGLAQAAPWSFVAGTTANLLGFEPLGSVPLALLVVAVLVGGTARVVGRAVWIFPVAASLIASPIYDGITLGIHTLLGTGVTVPDPLSVIVPAAAFNAVIAAILLVPARLLARRIADEEPAW